VKLVSRLVLGQQVFRILAILAVLLIFLKAFLAVSVAQALQVERDGVADQSEATTYA
jgi:cell division protein FtsB